MNKIKTPQFRTSLIRKIKNIFPEYEIIFTERESGLGFYIDKKETQSQSNVVVIHRFHERVLTNSWLRENIKFKSTNEIDHGT